MKRDHRCIRTALFSLLILGLPCAAGWAQERVESAERRVLVWKSEGDQLVEIEAGWGNEGFLGVTMIDLTQELRGHFGVPLDRGVMLSRVFADSPAQLAGLVPADIVTMVDGRPIAAGIDLAMWVRGADEGTVAALEFWRDGDSAKVEIPLAIQERSRIDIAPLIERRIRFDSPGAMRLHESDPHLAIDKKWLEEVVEVANERFSDADFRQQLEAMRLERTNLHDQLRLMEERLEQLEAELARLNDD